MADQVDEFVAYLRKLPPSEIRSTLERMGLGVADRFQTCLVLGSIQSPSDVAVIVDSLTADLDHADRVEASQALLRVLLPLIAQWFERQDLDPAASKDLMARLTAISQQIDCLRIQAAAAGPNSAGSTPEVPSPGIVEALIAETGTAIAGMEKMQAIAAIKAVTRPWMQLHTGPILLSPPKTKVELTDFMYRLADSQPPMVFGFVAVNLIQMFSRSLAEQLGQAEEGTPSAQMKMVMAQINRTLHVLGSNHGAWVEGTEIEKQDDFVLP